MASNIEKIASLLGAKVTGKLPEVGGGAFGVSRLQEFVKDIQSDRGNGFAGPKAQPRNPTETVLEFDHNRGVIFFASILSLLPSRNPQQALVEYQKMILDLWVHLKQTPNSDDLSSAVSQFATLWILNRYINRTSSENSQFAEDFPSTRQSVLELLQQKELTSQLVA